MQWDDSVLAGYLKMLCRYEKASFKYIFKMKHLTDFLKIILKKKKVSPGSGNQPNQYKNDGQRVLFLQ